MSFLQTFKPSGWFIVLGWVVIGFVMGISQFFYVAAVSAVAIHRSGNELGRVRWSFIIVLTILVAIVLYFLGPHIWHNLLYIADS